MLVSLLPISDSVPSCANLPVKLPPRHVSIKLADDSVAVVHMPKFTQADEFSTRENRGHRRNRFAGWYTSMENAISRLPPTTRRSFIE